MNTNNLITVTAAAEILGVSSRRVRALIASGRLPATTVTNRLYLLERSAVEKWKPMPEGRPKKNPKKKKKKH